MTIFLACVGLGSMAQTFKADDVVGTWLTSNKEGRIAIYKSGGKYAGKIQSGSSKSTEHFDVHNPEPARRKDSLIGLELLKNFKYDGDGKWTDGTIYDPKSGKTYSCNMTLTDRNTLRIRGYVGISLLGRTEVWTRVQ